jgi:hypothetical protein
MNKLTYKMNALFDVNENEITEDPGVVVQKRDT